MRRRSPWLAVRSLFPGRSRPRASVTDGAGRRSDWVRLRRSRTEDAAASTVRTAPGLARHLRSRASVATRLRLALRGDGLGLRLLGSRFAARKPRLIVFTSGGHDHRRDFLGGENSCHGSTPFSRNWNAAPGPIRRRGHARKKQRPDTHSWCRIICANVFYLQRLFRANRRPGPHAPQRQDTGRDHPPDRRAPQAVAQESPSPAAAAESAPRSVLLRAAAGQQLPDT